MKKGTLIAVGLFAFLLLAVLATRDRGPVSEGMPTLHLATFDPATVTGVEISGASAAILKKEGSGWSVTDPKGGTAHPADTAQVTSLLNQLHDLKPGNFITDKVERQAELEVDAAKGTTVKVLAPSGPVLSLVFGKAGKSGGGTYVRVDGDPAIFLTVSGASRMAHREAKGWRKRPFFPAPAADLTQLTTQFEDGTSLALAAVDGGWELGAGTATPPGFRFDGAAAGRVASAVAGLSASEFGDDLNDQTAGFAKPHVTVKALRKDGSTVTAQFAHPEPTPSTDGGAPTARPLYAVRIDGDSQVYLVAPFQAEAAIKHLDDFRDTSLLGFDPAKATKVTLQSGGKTTQVTNTSGTWAITEPKSTPTGFDFDPMQVTSLLNSLKTFRATRLVEGATPATAGLSKPTLTVDVDLSSGPAQRLVFGGDVPGTPAGQVFVQGSIDKLVYAVPTGSRTRFERGVDLFKRMPRPNPHGPGGMPGMPGMGGMHGGPGGGMQGLDSLPPDIRAKIEAQLRQQGKMPPGAPH